MNAKRLIPVVVAVVAIILLTQQSRQGVDPVESSTTPSPQHTATKVVEAAPTAEKVVGTAEPSSSAPELGDQPSKLAGVAGFGHNPQRDEEQFSAEEMQREELIADCMQQQGYDYTPTPSIVIDGGMAVTDTEELDQILREVANDPNDRYLASLSEIERGEYYIALTGVADPNDPEAQVYDIAVQSDSCASKAMRAVPGVYAQYNALRGEFEAMRQAVAEDPEVVQSLKDWSDCMSLAGFQYSHPRELDSLQDEALAAADAEQLQWLDQGRQMAANCDVKVALNQTYANVRKKHENLFYEFYRPQLVQ